MSEPNEITELDRLRQANVELTAKNASRKARIRDLETRLAAAQASATEAQATLHDIEVGQPVQTLANAISPMPELFLSEFGRVGYTVEKRDGKLTIIKDGNPVEGAEFTVAGVTKLLTKSDDPALKSFKHLVISNRASGGGASGSLPSGYQPVERKDAPVKPANSPFGLR